MNRVKCLREEKRLTQLQVSVRAEVSQQTLSRIETDGVLPQGETLIRLAKYFNVSTDYLLGLTDVKANQSQVKSRYGILANDILSQMNDKQKNDWLKMGKYIIGVEDNK